MSPAGGFAGPCPARLRPMVVGFVLAAVGCGVAVHEGAVGVGDRETLQFSLGFEPAPALGAFELRVGVVRADGTPAGAVSSCAIDVVMLSHGHEAAGQGLARVEGASCVLGGRSFQMSGTWSVRVEATTDEGVDEATFAVVVP